MKTSIFFIKILQILASRYGMSITLEEIAKLVTSTSNISKFSEDITDDRENQSKLLDVLIVMECKGYIFLNLDTDESSITIKGLIKVNKKIFWN